MMKMSEDVKKNKVKIDAVRYAVIHLGVGTLSAQNCSPHPYKRRLDISPRLNRFGNK